MPNPKFDSELAAHNVATILTQASIGEIEKETIPLRVGKPDITAFKDYSKQYAYYYKKFYNEALKHFNTILNDNIE